MLRSASTVARAMARASTATPSAFVRAASSGVQPFHHAFPVHDLTAARKFYGDTLKCEEGRSSQTWIDYSLYGHQVSVELCGERNRQTRSPLHPPPPVSASRTDSRPYPSRCMVPLSLLPPFQIVCHFASKDYRCVDYFNNVDKDAVPVPHFGVCLTVDEFHALAGRVKAAGIPFIVEPHLRFGGKPGEQWTMFFKVSRRHMRVLVTLPSSAAASTTATAQCSTS